MSNYYDPGPLVLLQRPVALIGPPGVDQHAMGRDLAALAGLTLIEVDRWIEHEAGQSLGALVQSQGMESLRRLEDRLLDRALSARPPGILVLGDGALLKEANCRRVVAETTLVYLELSLRSAYWKLRQQAREEARRPHPLFLQAPDHPDQLRALLEERRAGFEQAHLTLDMDALTPAAAVRLLLDRLPEWSAAPPG